MRFASIVKYLIWQIHGDGIYYPLKIMVEQVRHLSILKKDTKQMEAKYILKIIVLFWAHIIQD